MTIHEAHSPQASLPEQQGQLVERIHAIYSDLYMQYIRADYKARNFISVVSTYVCMYVFLSPLLSLYFRVYFRFSFVFVGFCFRFYFLLLLSLLLSRLLSLLSVRVGIRYHLEALDSEVHCWTTRRRTSWDFIFAPCNHKVKSRP